MVTETQSEIGGAPSEDRKTHQLRITEEINGGKLGGGGQKK